MNIHLTTTIKPHSNRYLNSFLECHELCKIITSHPTNFIKYSQRRWSKIMKYPSTSFYAQISFRFSIEIQFNKTTWRRSIWTLWWNSWIVKQFLLRMTICGFKFKFFIISISTPSTFQWSLEQGASSIVSLIFWRISSWITLTIFLFPLKIR